MRTFAERVRDEVGEGVGVAYYEEVFKKDDYEMLKWLSEQCNSIQSPIAESMQFVDVVDRRKTFHLGMRILEGDLRGMLFVVHELKARAETVTISGTADSQPPVHEIVQSSDHPIEAASIENPQERHIALRERIGIAAAFIGKTLYFAQVRAGLIKLEEKYMLIRPGDFFLYMYLSAAATIITALTTLADLAVRRNPLEAVAVLIATLLITVALIRLLAGLILDRWLVRTLVHEKLVPTE